MTAAPSDITRQLTAARQGDARALDQVFAAVYDELRLVARRALRAERGDHTLTTTALVNETYLKLVVQSRATAQDRAHFFALAAMAMRRILVDYARQHKREKRGGGRAPVTLDDGALPAEDRAEALLALDEALERLAALNERLAKVVECRFFGGMTAEETAEALHVTSRTVERDWRKARGWLYDQLRDSPL